MADEIQKIINAVTEEFDLQAGHGLKKEFSEQRVSEAPTSNTASAWKNKYLHLLSDLENMKKRLARASAVEIEVQNTELLRDLLQVADGLDLVLDHMSGEEDNRNIFPGIQGLKGNFDQFFIKYDVKPINALGTVFDPNLHEALGMVRNPAAVPNTVVKVAKKGYLYHDKLLRPAQVMVATG